MNVHRIGSQNRGGVNLDPILQRFLDAASRKNAVDEEEVDRIPGTSKIRTYCAN